VSSIIAVKLLGVFAVIGIGWLAGRTGTLGPGAAGVLTRAAFTIFTPALLLRTTAGIAIASLPWTTLAAYYGPTLILFLLAYGWQRLRRAPAPTAPVRALSLTFSNSVQLGIPVVTALFGAAGLAIHVALISMQALVLLTTATVLAEAELSRVSAERPHPFALLGQVVRRSVIHPVVLPILLGFAYHLTGWAIPGPVDGVLAALGQAVVPVSLLSIGLTLQLYGPRGQVRSALALAAGKVLLHPALVLAGAYGLFGLRGLPLTVTVLCAALPIGANVLLFADRYDVLRAETTAAILTSTLAFLGSGALWLLVLTTIGAGPR
jgi:malonate transporter